MSEALRVQLVKSVEYFGELDENVDLAVLGELFFLVGCCVDDLVQTLHARLYHTDLVRVADVDASGKQDEILESEH